MTFACTKRYWARSGIGWIDLLIVDQAAASILIDKIQNNDMTAIVHRKYDVLDALVGCY